LKTPSRTSTTLCPCLLEYTHRFVLGNDVVFHTKKLEISGDVDWLKK